MRDTRRSSGLLFYPFPPEDAHMMDSVLDRPGFWLALSPLLFAFSAVVTYWACALWW